MVVVDRFTTRDGRWEVDLSKPYSISVAALRKYGDVDIPGKGGATHIFVNAPMGSVVTFSTKGGEQIRAIVSLSGWVNHPMFASSGYNVDRGEQGPWSVFVQGIEVASGIGLPNGWHVSTFLIVGMGVSRPPEPGNPGDADKLRQVADLARRILELVSVLIVAMMLSGCQETIQIVPPWMAPIQDHDLRCVNEECRATPGMGRGPM